MGGQGQIGAQSAPPSAIVNRPARTLPPQQIDTSGAQTWAPREMTPAEEQNYYNPGGTDSQYTGIRKDPTWFTNGQTIERRTIVRRPDGQAVVLEPGTVISRETLYNAPVAGTFDSWFEGGQKPDSPYTQAKIRQQELDKIRSQQYVQQFGLPQGDTSTWRGWLAQYIGGATEMGAVGGALGGGVVGLMAGGPVGAIGGAIVGGLLGGGVGAWSDPQGVVAQQAAAMGLADAKKQFDDGVYGLVGKPLAWMGQTTEQVLGTGSQALSDPADTFANLGAAWQAAQMYYESDPAAGLRQSSTTFVDTDLPDITGGAAAMAEARKAIAANPDQAEQIMAVYQARYGAFGMLRDLIGQSVLDPSNLVFGYLANRGVAAGARAAGAAQVLDDAGRVVGYAGKGATLLEAAEKVKPTSAWKAWFGGGGLIDVAEVYKNLKVMEPFSEVFQGARDLNLLQRILLGKDAVSMYDGTWKAPKGWEMFSKTPSAMAHEAITEVTDLLQSHITENIPLNDQFPVVADQMIQQFKGAQGIPAEGADSLTRAARSLRGGLAQRVLEFGGDVSGDLVRVWQNNRTEAGLVETIAKALGISGDDVVKAGVADLDGLLAQYTRAGGALPENVNPKSFGAVLRMFQSGDVPRTPVEYKAALLGQLASQAGQWSVNAFGITAPRFLERLANLNKGVQSAVLLGANVGYAINNVLNNEVTFMARGSWGLRTPKDLESELVRRGIPVSVREGDATLTADLVGEVEHAQASMADIIANRSNEELRAAMKPPDDLMAKAQGQVSRVGRMMPVTQMAQKAERFYSQRALYTATLQKFTELWQPGSAFARMDAGLEQALRAVDARLPETIYAAIENGANPTEITAAVFDQVGRVSVASVVDDAARRSGISGAEARQILTDTGLAAVLDERLAALGDNPTVHDVRRTFNDVRVEAEAHIAQVIGEQAKVEYQAAAQFAGADTGIMDGGAVLMLMDQNRMRQLDAYTSHARIRQSIWEERLNGAIDADVFSRRLEDAGTQMYERGLFPLQQANIDGIAEAFKTTGQALPEEFTTLQRSVAMLTKDFHAEKQALYREFFKLPRERQTAAAWAEIVRQIDEAYNNLTGHVAERQALMDEYIAVAYESRFPGSGNPIREWRDTIRAHEAQYQEAVRAQFEEARLLTDPQARNTSWRQFDARMTKYRLAWSEDEMKLRRAAMGYVPGRDALEAEARRLRGLKAQAMTRPVIDVSQNELIRTARASMPEPLSRAVAQEAQQMLSDLKQGEKGGRQFNYDVQGGPPEVTGVASSYPKWYGQLKRPYDTTVRALERIINGVKDVDKGIQDVVTSLKEIIVERLATTDPVTGRPPEPEVMRWLGKSSDTEIQAAADAWAATGFEPSIPRIVTDQAVLTPEQADTLVRNLSVQTARENMGAGAKVAHDYRVRMVDPLGVAEVVDLATSKVYEVRIDQVEADAMLPPGMLAQDGGLPMPIGSAQSEMFDRTRPVLESMQQAMLDHVEGGTLRGAAEASPEVQAKVRAYLKTATDKLADTKLLAVRWGEARRDAALLNYNRRYMFDNLMGIVSPYQFWATHSMLAWATESLSRPAVLATYYRTRKFLATAVTRAGTPSRLGGRIKLPVPVPDWMGGGLWVDPLKIGLPMETFSDPWEQVAQRQSRLNDRIESQLDDMLNNADITRDEWRAARDYIATAGQSDSLTAGLRTASGLGEPSAYTQAKQAVIGEDPSLRYDLVDFAAQMFPPALLVNMAYQTLRGTPERQGPLPITRDIRNLTAGLGIGGPGGVNIEGWVRQQVGLPVFDEWQDYRIDRELANMTVEGLITPEQAKAAMIERQGSAFEMAQQREAQQGGADPSVQLFGRLFGGATVFPEGEATGRQLQLLYRAAQQAQDNGDTGAISEFLDRFPEVEARLALGKDPEARMRNFMQDQIWAAYDNMPTLYRRQAQAQFGQDFVDAMRTSNWDGIPVETLAAWARTLGRYVPDNMDGPALDLQWAPEGVAYQVQQFYDQRNATYDMQVMGQLLDGYYALDKYEKQGLGTPPEDVAQFYAERDRLYPGIGELLGAYSALPKNSEPAAREQQFPGIGGLLDQYYALPKGSGERKAYLKANPVIRDYFDWKDQYKAAHPEDGARAAFRDAHPEITAYFQWSDGYKAEHPAAGQYIESDAPRLRDVYVQDHPDLDQYWTWRRSWMDAHPESAAWIKETTPPTATTDSQQAQDATDTQAAPTREVVGSDALKGLVEAYLFGGRKLGYSARQKVEEAFQRYGRDGQTLDQYLIQVMAGGGVLEVGQESGR